MFTFIDPALVEYARFINFCTLVDDVPIVIMNSFPAAILLLVEADKALPEGAASATYTSFVPSGLKIMIVCAFSGTSTVAATALVLFALAVVDKNVLVESAI